MISRSRRFQEDFLSQLQLDISIFANSEGEGFVENIKAKVRPNESFIRKQPRSLAEILGHKKTLQLFTEWTCTGRYPAVTILSGFRGIGKTTILELFVEKGMCTKFNLEKCIFSPCRYCIHRPPFPRIVDCASSEISFIKRNTDLYFGTLFDIRNRIIFLDEFNENKASEISRYLTRRIEKASDTFLFIACNEGVENIDYGLKTRATNIVLNIPSLAETTAWLYKYALAENIKISLFDAFTITKSTRPDCIPREALKKLEFLYGIKPSEYLNRINMMLNIDEETRSEMADSFTRNESEIEKELQNWE